MYGLSSELKLVRLFPTWCYSNRNEKGGINLVTLKMSSR